MAEPSVVFDKVWKKFRRGERHDTLRDLLPSLAKSLFSRKSVDTLEKEEFWAVSDTSFSVSPGEALGIIGPNGAGKSTALKLLTKILRPTMGECRVRGRVGALIEVSSGFHPDLTGRENIFLQGAIMGMRQVEIARSLDEIVAFSGIEAFIDTQVKRYSSGMQARLGFSVAAHLNPDVFFVDEVLSVGDLSFQGKCIERMHQQIDAGVTLVFVSHNLQAVASLCKRVVVMGKGKMLFDGPTEDGLDVYLKASQTASTKWGAQDPSFVVRGVQFSRADGADPRILEPHTPCVLEVVLQCVKPADDFFFGLEFERTRDLLYCYGVTSAELGHAPFKAQPGETFRIAFAFNAHFARGHFRVNFNVRSRGSTGFLVFAENVANFAIEERITYDGVVDVGGRMSVQREAMQMTSEIVEAPVSTRG
jgi:lipopolysaccharide transport system ATP-binding protein